MDLSSCATPDLVADHLLDVMRSFRGRHYGESIDLLDHSLCTAANARLAGASDELVVAALFHDLGHDGADGVGLADHADVAARALDGSFGRAVVEPIRWHVEAKRYLVTVEPSYLARLSDASLETLRLQGGSLTDDDVIRWEANPFAADAVALRRWDDDGKSVGAAFPPLDDYRELIVGLASTR